MLKQNRQSTNESNSLCISSTNIAQRRLFFEKRLDLSIVEESGGFVQIDSFIFPYIKCSHDNENEMKVTFILKLLTKCFHSKVIKWSANINLLRFQLCL
ncbi:unnamed protein product [Rotaria sp. Silwood2]|nr:unnamed protein product [Rotaria sp. Silwood2]